ncbi:unnamed protein product [Euphydryas editha]|uniref:Uncharacterized protein n=1 Tax=Euphydryas editha TaxID=104508 RepID=A0AAU9TCP0_EUPED|nr:unnamed protein product [Euphydryas editha]
MYWEQLELRCRSLYRPPSGQPVAAAGRQVQTTCNCCAQCAAPPAWDFTLQHRFWAPGRIGNLYSPNPGTGRKTSPWSWFPWPRMNSQNSRCRMSGVPQSGDSAYGFCETEQNQPGQSYDERTYPTNFDQFQRQTFPQNTPTFTPNTPNFPQTTSNFAQSSANFGQSSNFQGYPQGASFQAPGLSGREAGGCFDAQTGVWGPPPPYSPQGRSASRHHLHQDPATTTLLHHHVDPRVVHDHSVHTCRNYHDMTRINPELAQINPEMNRMNSDLSRLNPDLNRMNPDLNRMNPELMYPSEPNDIRLRDLASVERLNTLRGHLVPYRGCTRALVPDGAIECLHQKSASKVSDQSSDSCQKQGKENLGFQNDKHSPIRSSMRATLGAESEVYFADVSSCCNVSVQADCCINPNVSLVGTIETHPESTSESDTGSLTLTRQQRPQPQVGSKRRPRQTDKHAKTQEKIRQDFNSSIRLTEQQIEHLNSSMRMERMNDSRISERVNEPRICERMNESRISERINEPRISERMNELRISERMNEPRIIERMNESRISERMADIRMSDRMIDSRDRLNDSRIERMNESRESRDSRDRLNESRESRDSRDRLNERERMAERINESDRSNDSRIDRNDSRDRLNDSRSIDRDRLNDRINDSRVTITDRDRLNDSRVMSDRDRMNDSRVMIERDRLSDSRFEDRRLSDLNSSLRIEGSPKRSHMSPLRMPRTSPKERSDSKEFYLQNRQDSKEFFPQNLSPLSPLSPNTEESLLSSEGDRREETVYSNEPEASKSSKCLAPDSQYEPVREQEDILKLNHHHCYSDTNTMDSGWQSGSEKQVTD